jgi:hypothetical protein
MNGSQEPRRSETTAGRLLRGWMAQGIPRVPKRGPRNHDRLNRSRHWRPARSYRVARDEALAAGALCQHEVPV